MTTNAIKLPTNKWQNILEDLLSHTSIQINGSSRHDIQVLNPNFYKRVIQDGSIGLGESYMDGWWQCADLDQMCHHLLRNEIDEKRPETFGDALFVLKSRLFNLQSKKRAWIVGEEHYDLGPCTRHLLLTM